MKPKTFVFEKMMVSFDEELQKLTEIIFEHKYLKRELMTHEA